VPELAETVFIFILDKCFYSIAPKNNLIKLTCLLTIVVPVSGAACRFVLSQLVMPGWSGLYGIGVDGTWSPDSERIGSGLGIE
jgi:hypothetical protein